MKTKKSKKFMTIGELKKKLNGYPNSTAIVLLDDGYRKLICIGNCGRPKTVAFVSSLFSEPFEKHFK